ncbi:hypothetical protein BGZ81_010785 [Podila clonocystis]|nr:hypothetical protein BGZ81_010785 [Podila clonocystis]
MAPSDSHIESHRQCLFNPLKLVQQVFQLLVILELDLARDAFLYLLPNPDTETPAQVEVHQVPEWNDIEITCLWQEHPLCPFCRGWGHPSWKCEALKTFKCHWCKVVGHVQSTCEDKRAHYRRLAQEQKQRERERKRELDHQRELTAAIMAHNPFQQSQQNNQPTQPSQPIQPTPESQQSTQPNLIVQPQDDDDLFTPIEGWTTPSYRHSASPAPENTSANIDIITSNPYAALDGDDAPGEDANMCKGEDINMGGREDANVDEGEDANMGEPSLQPVLNTQGGTAYAPPNQLHAQQFQEIAHQEQQAALLQHPPPQHQQQQQQQPAEVPQHSQSTPIATVNPVRDLNTTPSKVPTYTSFHPWLSLHAVDCLSTQTSTLLPTYYSLSHGSYHTIDYIFCSSSLFSRINPHPPTHSGSFSDHSLLSTSLAPSPSSKLGRGTALHAQLDSSSTPRNNEQAFQHWDRIKNQVPAFCRRFTREARQRRDEQLKQLTEERLSLLNSIAPYDPADILHTHLYAPQLRACKDKIAKMMEERLDVLALRAGKKDHEEGSAVPNTSSASSTKRQEYHLIHSLKDMAGVEHTATEGLLEAAREFMTICTIQRLSYKKHRTNFSLALVPKTPSRLVTTHTCSAP